MLTGEVPPVDGFVVRNPVPQRVKAPHTASHIGANLSGIVAGRMPGKHSGKAWNPNRRVVRAEPITCEAIRENGGIWR